MNKFTVLVTEFITAWGCVEVEAENQEEAIEKAVEDGFEFDWQNTNLEERDGEIVDDGLDRPNKGGIGTTIRAVGGEPVKRK